MAKAEEKRAFVFLKLWGVHCSQLKKAQAEAMAARNSLNELKRKHEGVLQVTSSRLASQRPRQCTPRRR